MKHSLAVACTACLVVANAALAKEPFTVAHSIAMTELVDPSSARAADRVETFKVSPNGTWLAVVTKSGNLQSGENEYRLLILSVEEVRRYVVNAESGSLPRMAEAARFDTSSFYAGIDEVTWLADDRQIAFIGRSNPESSEVYLYDVPQRALRQITKQDRNIIQYALAANTHTLIYAAYVPPDWSVRNKYGYAVGSDYGGTFEITDPAQAVQEIRYFIFDAETKKTTPVALGASRVVGEMSVSRMGTRAVVSNYDVRVIPASWSQYAQVQGRLRGLRASADSTDAVNFANNAFGNNLDWLGRRYVVDTRDGSVSVLTDAPVINEGVRSRISWSADDRHIAISPSYLPLEQAAGRELERRRTTPAIVEVDLARNAVRRIVDVSDGASLRSLEWLDDRTVSVGYGDAEGVGRTCGTFHRDGIRWASGNSGASCEPAAKAVFRIAQDMNTPYEIIAKDIATSKERMITDLNPQLRQLDLGSVETMEWTDAMGRQHRGGLLLPRGYEPGKRYPAVLQTYGFNPGSFLVDGPFGIHAAYAARPLASSGFVVLQMETRDSVRTNCRSWEPCGENELFVATVESAIDALDARSLIDRGRVGLIGWSREGMHVFHALTFGRYRIAAATVADSVAFTPFGYVMAYGTPYPGMLQFEQMIGGSYWGKGIELWKERSPAFHLDRITTPLRLEAYGKGISNYWDAFAILTRQQRPVELFHIPLDTHLLETPLGRFASQQGNVDWYRFWLKEEEDADPSKADQYRRWRALRVQHKALLRATDTSGSEQ